MEDSRRFEIGTYDSNYQSDSVDLVAALAPHLSSEQRAQLEARIVSWSRYRDGVELAECQREADREARVRLLCAVSARTSFSTSF